MNRVHLFQKASITLASLLAAVATTTVASAQMSQGPEVVTVTAPRIAIFERTQGINAGAPIEQVTFIQQVSYQDLDLKTQKDVTELENRVKGAAEQGCTMLDNQYHMASWSNSHEDCVGSATNGAMAQVNAAVAAATRPQ